MPESQSESLNGTSTGFPAIRLDVTEQPFFSSVEPTDIIVVLSGILPFLSSLQSATRRLQAGRRSPDQSVGGRLTTGSTECAPARLVVFGWRDLHC